MRENDKMLNRQNFSIYNTAEHCIINSSDMNSKRVRCIEVSNRTVLRHKFVSEEEKEV